jgi:A1 cistron-splicing factor AAR2
MLYSVDLDPETAKSLASSGACVVMLDVPQGTVVGVDQQAFAVGPKYKGLKMVPPGVHFLSWQAAGTDNQFAPTVSCFVHLSGQQVHVRRWDARAEVAAEVQDEEEV